jgi:hypothetical protein
MVPSTTSRSSLVLVFPTLRTHTLALPGCGDSVRLVKRHRYAAEGNPWVFAFSILVVLSAVTLFPDDWSLPRMCLVAVAVAAGWSLFLRAVLVLIERRRRRTG